MKEFFENGYGVSVIDDGRGKEQGLKELAVLTYTKSPNGLITNSYLCYDTPITGDVEGYLTDDDVARLIAEVKALPKSTEPLIEAIAYLMDAVAKAVGDDVNGT